MGMPRTDVLYHMQQWEIQRAIKGYRKRDTLKHQLLAECAYAAIYAMRDPKGKTVADMFPVLFSDEDEEEPSPITEEDRQDLIDLMQSMNNHKG